ncbi:MAG: hypothetical protein ACLQU1_00140 [Bryobacteraceae bacterium]
MPICDRPAAPPARQAYRDAAGAVGALAQRYGEATLFDWLRTGLPPAVKNASSSQAPTKSKYMIQERAD